MSLSKRARGALTPRSWFSISRTVAILSIVVAGIGLAIVMCTCCREVPNPHSQFLHWEVTEPTPELAALAGSAATAVPPDSERIVYPYSVVPGGVRSPEELQRASLQDAVVAEHYAQFDFKRAHVIRLQQAKLVYLSYRVGGQVFWTRKRIKLPRGEKLISDGKIMARTRCANRLSEVRQGKISPEEPLPEALEQAPIPAAPVIPMLSAANFNSLAEAYPQVPAWSVGPIPVVGPGGGFPPIDVPPIVYGCNPRLERCSATPPSVSPPTTVPESDTWVLIALAIAGVGGMWRKLGMPG